MADVATRTRLGRAYWCIWSAATVSTLGDGLALVAFPLLAARLTDDPRLISGVLLADRLPWLLIALPAGALADRVDRVRLMALVDLARTLVLLVLALVIVSHGLTLPILYACALALGGFESVFQSAAFATVPAVVDDDQLERANGLLFATETTGNLVGPAVGGLVFALAASAPFEADAISFIASALVLVQLRRLLAPPRPTPSGRSLWADAAEGGRWFWRNPLLRLLSVVVAGMALCQAMVFGLLVLFGLRTLHLSSVGYGVFLGISCAGNVVGALVADRLTERFGAARVLAGAGLLAAVAYIGLGRSSSVVPAAAFAIVEAFAVAAGLVTSLALRQRHVPDELRGRVGNAFRMVVFGAAPIGSLLGGVVAHATSVRTTFLLAGVAQALLIAMTARPLARALTGAGDATEVDVDLTALEVAAAGGGVAEPAEPVLL